MTDTTDSGPIEIDTSEPEIVTTIDQQGDVEAKEPEAPEPEEKPAEQEEGEGDKQEDEPEKEPLRDDKGRYKGSAQHRIDQAIAAQREAERRAARAEALLSARSNADAPAKPNPDQFEDYGEYVEALADWKADQRDAQRATAEVDRAREEAGTARTEAWQARVASAAATIADYGDVVGKSDLPVAHHVGDALMDAERGPELAYHLAKNPEMVDRLNQMSPARAAMELGRIEATLGDTAEPPKPRETKQSKAPTPITPVASGSNVTKDPSKMNMDEYSEWRKAQGIR